MKHTSMKRGRTLRVVPALTAFPIFCAALIPGLPMPSYAQQEGPACMPPACPEMQFPASKPKEGLVLNPKEIGGYVDFGQAFSDPDKQPLTRTGAYLTASGVWNERLEVRASLGGLFWYAFPELTSSSRVVRFGPGVGQAQAVYSFGDDPRNNPSAKLQFGLFPVKYNADATNLGEYLYRSGTYPGYVWTGGWSYLNSASFLMQGVRFSLPTMGGMFKHDLTLHMERDVAQPLHDFSPGYMATIKPVKYLEVGAGVVWSNALSFKPSRLSPKEENNAYSKTTGMPLLGLDEALCGSSDTALSKLCADPNLVRANQTLADTNGNLGYYTFRGFKTMARVSLDVGALVGADMIRPGEFKLYSEAALLGVEDQSFYYEDKLERLPVMFGVRLPTFGLLDRLAVEAEYRKSRFPNSFAYPFDNLGALPLPLGGNGDTPYDYTDDRVEANAGDRYTKDDWKWSVYASRQITSGVTLTAQVASDHLRPPSNVANPPSIPYTQTAADWYYVMRVAFGI